MATDSMRRAKRKYLGKCKQVNFTVYPTESDILEMINSVESKTGYLKALVREDIEMIERERIYHEQTDDLTTGEVREMADAVIRALGGDIDVMGQSVEYAQGVISRAMALRDRIIGEQR